MSCAHLGDPFCEGPIPQLKSDVTDLRIRLEAWVPSPTSRGLASIELRKARYLQVELGRPNFIREATDQDDFLQHTKKWAEKKLSQVQDLMEVAEDSPRYRASIKHLSRSAILLVDLYGYADMARMTDVDRVLSEIDAHLDGVEAQSCSYRR
jgi:hypothetical protein